MKILIVGLGSIARKHINAIRVIDSKIELYALRNNSSENEYYDVKNIFSWADVPADISFIIIANPTSEHYKTIVKSIEFNVPIFIEKPPLMDLNNGEELVKLIADNKIITYVAFNLRFHPVIRWLKENLDLTKVIEVQAYCGSYLPLWRPGKNYSEIYSAKKDLGGGVHLDLIHELDFIFWIFGKTDRVFSLKGKKSSLEIDSYDVAIYNLEFKNYIITILLNYYRKDPKRSIEIVMEDRTLYVDLLKASISDADGRIIFNVQGYDNLVTYKYQMEYFLDKISSKHKMMNSLEESLEILRICLR